MEWKKKILFLCFDYNYYLIYDFNYLYIICNFLILSFIVGFRDNFRDFDMCLCLDDLLDVIDVKGLEVDVMFLWIGDGFIEYKDEILLFIFFVIKIY